MRIAAAIRRASRQARNAMYELDQQGAADLLAIYQDAARDVRARIAAATDASDTVPVYRLQELLRQVEAVIDALGERRNELLMDQIDRAANLGVRPFTMQGIAAVGGTEAVLTSSAASLIHENAVKFVRDFTQADGFNLSSRLWRLDRGAREALTRSIGMAVVQGSSATRAAQDFVLRGQPVPPDVARQIARGRVPDLLSAADLLTEGTGDGYWQAERVMRTEINRAHGEAFTESGQQTRDFAGWRYLLSPRHPAPDICDLLSTQNLYGLGPGVYPDRESTPWPAHPNILSFLEIVFQEEITDEDRAGKETSLEALKRLAPAVRAGAIGKTKATYFDKGLLATGMIRSPLYSVDRRLKRQGKMPSS